MKPASCFLKLLFACALLCACVPGNGPSSGASSGTAALFATTPGVASVKNAVLRSPVAARPAARSYPHAGDAGTPYKVGIYYFGMFSPKAYEADGLIFSDPNFYWNNQLDRTGDFWAGVKDLHDHNYVQETMNDTFRAWWNLNWDHLEPAIGWYDQSKVQTLEKHIRQATQNGIHYFSFYWYWNQYLHNESVNDGLDSFLAAQNSSDMEFMIDVCAHGYYWTIDVNDIPKVTDLIVNKYFLRDNYLKTKAGQPIINICDARGIWDTSKGKQDQYGNIDRATPPNPFDYGTIKIFLDTLREKTLASKLQTYPVITYRADDPSQSEMIKYVEAGACLLPQAGQGTGDLAALVQNVSSYLTQLKSYKPFMPCYEQNLDSRPRMGVMIKDLSKFAVMSNSAATDGDFRAALPGTFRSGLQAVKGWMDQQSDELSKHVTLYAWNEWHEGGQIEPNAKDGAAYLNVINDVFGLAKGSDPCRTTGNCASITAGSSDANVSFHSIAVSATAPGCHVVLPNGCPNAGKYNVSSQSFLDTISATQSDGTQCKARASDWFGYCGLGSGQSAMTYLVDSGGNPSVGRQVTSQSSVDLSYQNGTWVQAADNTTRQIYRYYQSQYQIFLYTAQKGEGDAYGFSYEYDAFHLFTASSSSRKALYRCLISSTGDRFLSVQSDCEGQTSEGVLGYLEGASVSNASTALYRCYNSTANRHLVTTNTGECTLGGFSVEGALGYVP